MYAKKVMEYFKSPKHVGTIKNADGVGEVGNMKCGDILKLYIKVKDNVIKEIKFETFGCVAAIASSEALCRVAKGKTVDEAEKLSNEDVIKELGGDVPAVKVHCSFLAIDALKKAIKDYKK
ncbi:iron-sulfur cluster assembly scaffold protein [archaeon]|jgi:nitrogen fixation protein NifU and related proteins|nr:iron-sulfur cluster assembly scaffold protein [archaeon]MBT4417253.1 iron-sulfur cluster assembly scaffold protein [archaeon]